MLPTSLLLGLEELVKKAYNDQKQTGAFRTDTELWELYLDLHSALINIVVKQLKMEKGETK